MNAVTALIIACSNLVQPSQWNALDTTIKLKQQCIERVVKCATVKGRGLATGEYIGVNDTVVINCSKEVK